jgi:hypothetical protein
MYMNVMYYPFLVYCLFACGVLRLGACLPLLHLSCVPFERTYAYVSMS